MKTREPHRFSCPALCFWFLCSSKNLANLKTPYWQQPVGFLIKVSEVCPGLAVALFIGLQILRQGISPASAYLQTALVSFFIVVVFL